MIIVFDLDEVLYDEKTFVKSGFHAVARHLDKNKLIPLKTSLRFLNKRLGINRTNVFDDLLKEHGIFTKKKLQKCISVYRTHKPRIKVFPEIEECLKKFKEYPIYIVTDGNKLVQKNKIKALKLEKKIKCYMLTSNYKLKNAKPSPYCFLKICDLENVKPNDVVYVGDDPNKDFVGIKPLGFKTIRVLKGKYKKLLKPKKFEAHMKINSLKEFNPQMLEKIS
ncbi:HAD family hydrolase [Nitrosopumilus sp.]|uniref:HAD family hydrolase n=1 Tax=Nitrosopumilus sp. TaxID=2024843 RepID=UPI003D0E186F